MKYNLILFPPAFLLFLCACAIAPQKVLLAPAVNAPADSLGKGVRIAVRAEDKRNTDILGNRKKDSVSITTDQNVPALFAAEIARGLRNRGFEVSPESGQAAITVTVVVREFDYKVLQGLITSRVQSKWEIGARVNRKNEEFTRTYKEEDERTVAFVPGVKRNQELINQLFAGIIEEILGDNGLLSFLKKQGPLPGPREGI